MDALGSGFAYLSGRQHTISQLGHIRLLDGNNVSIGVSAGESVQGGDDNVFLGSYAGANAVSNTSVCIGSYTGSDASQVTNSVFQGYRAAERAEYITNSVYIGPYTGQQAIRSTDTVLIGYQAGANLTSGSRNVVLGSYAGFSQYNAFDNVIIGHRAGYSNKLGSNNVFLGTQSGYAATDALENVCLGVSSGENLVSGAKNVVCGFRAGAFLRNASNCIAMGTRAMEFFSNGDTNTCLGTQVARHFTGNNNTILGGYSTANALGNFNTIVGSRSMNRQTLEQVNLSNCVILGENIQFDIPVRPVTATVGDFDTLPDMYLNSTYDDVTVLFQDADESYGTTTVSFTMNIVPVGDPMVIRERYFSFGTYDNPCVLDTSEDGSYTVRWGSAVDDTNALLETVPIEVVIERYAETMSVRARVYGDETSWDIDVVDELHVVVEQTFDPPALTLTVNDETFEPTGTLPGTPIPLDAFGQNVSDSLYTVYANASTVSLLVPGQEIQIVQSAIGGLNGVFRVRSVNDPGPDGFVPITVDVRQRITQSDLGRAALLLPSRVIEVADVQGEEDVDGIRVTVPALASFLVGTLTSPRVYVHGDGDVDGGVYDVDVLDAPTSGEFVVRGVTSTSLGTVSMGTLEPLLVGFDVTTTGPSKSIGSLSVVYNQRADTGLQQKTFEGPYAFDGHVHVGAGTQEDMDTNIRSNIITFSADGYSAAEYTIGALNSNVSVGSVFLLQDDIHFGIEWLNSYTVSCITYGTWFECLVTYALGDQESVLANVSNDGISMGGDLNVYTLTRADINDTFELVETEYPLSIGEPGVSDTVEVRVNHDIQRKSLGVEVVMYTDFKILALFMNFTETRPPSRQSRTLRFFADGALSLLAARYTNNFYQDYPSFSDCIFIGSNFTVGGNAALEERSNVCIASIGTERLFRGRFDEFEFFSDRVIMPTFVATGTTTGQIEAQTATVSVFPANGNAVYVEGFSDLEDVHIRGETSFVGDVTMDSTLTVASNVGIGGTLTVDETSTLASLIVDDYANIGGDVTILGTAFTNDVDVTGDVTVSGDVGVASNVIVDKQVGCETLVVSADASVEGACFVEKTLTVSGASELESVEVNTDATVGGRLDVDNLITTGVDVYIAGASVTGDFDALDVRATDIENDVRDIVVDISGLDGRLDTVENDIDGLLTAKFDADGGTISGSVTIDGTLDVGTVDDSSATKVAVWDGNRLKQYAGDFVTDTSLFSTLNEYVRTSGGDTIAGALTVGGEFEAGTVYTNDRQNASGYNAVITGSGRIGPQVSSARYKDEILPMSEEMVNSVWGMQPCTFVYKNGSNGSNRTRDAGFIAEQVDGVGFTEGVVYDATGRPDGIRQTGLLAVTVAALQQLARRVEVLEKNLPSTYE